MGVQPQKAMTLDSLLGQARPILKLIGAACILIAAAKLAGIGIPIRAGVTELSLVGLGLLHI